VLAWFELCASTDEHRKAAAAADPPQRRTRPAFIRPLQNRRGRRSLAGNPTQPRIPRAETDRKSADF
jgi:hypothetical protein